VWWRLGVRARWQEPNDRNNKKTMKCNQWTLALLGAGLISLPSVTNAEEKPNSIVTALSSTTLSGYVDTSAEWNPGTGNQNLPPYAFSSGKADGFNLDVVKLTLEKPVDQADNWGAGYKVDLVMGPDANGLNTSSTGSSEDFGVKQAYVALHAPVGNGLDFKVGVWDTIIGYEVFEAGNNPNFTRSWGYTMEPTTHTGVQGTYVFCESFSATLGIANTFGPTINGRALNDSGTQRESYKTYMGSVTFTAPTNTGFFAGSTLTACIINGWNASVAGGNDTHYYVGGTMNTPVTGLKVGVAFDDLDARSAQGETWSLGGYVAYQATEKLSLYGRVEYLRDRGNQKFFVKTVDLTPGDPTTAAVVPSAPDKVVSLTGTVQYDLWKNVLSRLEVRWDHAANGEGVWGNTVAGTGIGNERNAVVLAANVIYKF
jgi:hypothetical protein